MGTAVELSPSLVVRLKALVDDIGGFYWEEPERAEPLINNLCGGASRECALLMMSIHEKVPRAINRAMQRSQGESVEAILRFVAKHFSLRAAIDREEANWTVNTISAAVGLIPVSEEALEAAAAEAEQRAAESGGSPLTGGPMQTPAPPPGYSYQTRQPAAPQGRRIMPFALQPSQTAPPAPIGPWAKQPSSGKRPS